MATDKQKVLIQFPNAKCFELWPESHLYLVATDGQRPNVGTKKEYDAGPGTYFATAAQAWQAAATALGEQNAVATKTPFVL